MLSKTREISNSDDVIDSRDVIARIEELENLGDDKNLALEHFDELRALRSLAAEGEGSTDWTYGETLIRDSYFETYAQELADDCCPWSNNSPERKALDSWPYCCIDWQQAARELKMDYFSVSFDGVDYWIHS